eukprot:XP_001709613.1 Hypothetical protein GL50803_26228 [Giardia lamblia ATCC 50803]
MELNSTQQAYSAVLYTCGIIIVRRPSLILGNFTNI